MAFAFAGTALRVLGSVARPLEGTERGFASAPLLVALAVAPVLLAGVLVARSNRAAGAAVLLGAALLAPGAALVDLQLVVDPSVASRPELYLPTDLSLPEPALGLWALLAGHGAVLIAGLLSFAALRSEGAATGDGSGLAGLADPADSGGAVAAWRRRYVRVALPAAVAGGCGLVMTPFYSADVYLLAQNAFEGPSVELVGSVLCALALPVGAVLLVAGAREVPVARGGLGGLALALAAVALPSLVAAFAMSSLDVGGGSVLAVVGAAGLAVTAAAFRAGSDGEGNALGSATEGAATTIPGTRKLEITTGVLAVITGVLSVAGSLLPQVELSGGGPAPQSPARWLLLAAGLLLGIAGLALFSGRLAPAVRPVVSMVWVGVPLAATAVLDTALTSGYTPSVLSPPGPGGPAFREHLAAGAIGSGPGVLLAWLAMMTALVTVCCSVLAGVVEREDLDEEPGAEPGIEGGGISGVGLRMLTPLTAAAVLSVAAFATPMVTAPGYVETGLLSDVGPPTWGLVAAVLTVIGGCALAARSRPARAAALLAGVACVVGLRAATVPLVGGEVEGSSAGLGLWFSLAAVVALGVCAVIAVRGHRRA